MDKNKNLYCIHKSNEVFNCSFIEGRNRHERVMWADSQKQYFRFSEILHFIDSRNCSVLDIGCGNGELLKFLNFHGFKGEYTGIDVNEGLLNEARERYPTSSFRKLDILADQVEMHDYVVMSGVFGLNFGQDEEFVQEFIKGMFAACNNRTIFNALTTYVGFREEELFYIDPCSLIDFIARHVSEQFEIRHSFLPFNFTVCVHKEIKWRSLNEIGADLLDEPAKS